MDKLEEYRQVIENILSEYEKITPNSGEVQLETVFDRNKDRYLLMIVGRQNNRRIHGCFLHVDIINGKFWIHHDNSDEGIATQLLEAGVPKEHIVLAFKSPELRKYTEFAVA